MTLLRKHFNLQKIYVKRRGIPVIKRIVIKKNIIPREKTADEPLTESRTENACVKAHCREQEIDTRCESIKCSSNRFAAAENPANVSKLRKVSFLSLYKVW
ncbi:hypothetical protein TNIN_343641 [Trichonephila inaurata madagascariensis]|uniref:Uncharacterized protein n=1 Tax=Trichonephila inaurata madagascariensis TaxID=2747483 RepID=A0A8X6XIB9_9ARAC|nr:hypothetical protein TNIN_343641 [Trichonephila inaurata madagascariensis]